MSFFRDTSISNKILIPPVIMVVALGAVLLIAIHGFNKQGSVLIQVHDIALERTTLVNEFISLSESVQSDLFRIAVLRYMNLPEPEIQAIYEHLEQGLSNLGVIYGHILNKWLLDQKEKKILEQMRVPMDAFSHGARQAAAVVSQNPSFGILLVRSAAVPFAGFRSLLKEFLDYQKEKIVQAETISKQTVDTVKTTATAIALFTAFIAILITVLIGTRLISRPIRSITDAMGQLAGGNLSTGGGDLNRKDEIGSMAKAVEVFRQNAVEKRAAEEELRRHRDHLEQMVEERTKELREAQEELVHKEKLALIGELSGNISHELKNSLGVVDSSVYYLKMRLRDVDKKVEEHLDRIRMAVTTSVSVISSLTDLTRMRDPRLHKQDLMEILSEIIKEVEVPESVNLVRKFLDHPVIIDGDREQLGMAFRNVINNAMASMDRQGVLTVTTRKADENQIEISFADTGPGIAPENLKRIFQPLFTTRAKGLGFGLSVTRMAIERNRGTIDVKSEEGQGATFIIRLPIHI